MDMDKPFSHLFNSNAAPQPLEIASIQCEVDELTQSIGQVQLQLDRLQEQLRKLEGQRQGCRALLSPLRRIPPETLGEIIGCVLDLVKEDSAIPNQSHPLFLCLVCRSWRDAALATPKLWSSLKMCGVPTSLWLDTAFRWFGRCKGISKTLSIDGPLHDYQCCTTSAGGCKFANSALAKLLTEGPMVDKLCLSCTSSQCFRNLIKSMNSLKTVERRPWDSINSLQVAFHDAWSEPGPQDSHSDSIFSHIPPAVSTLNLHLGYKEKIVAINNELHLHIPETVLTNLTTFTFSYDWNGTMMLKLLQSCTNVENLTLDFKGSFMEYEDTPFTQGAFQEGLLLPKVRTLHLDRMLPDIVYFLRALRTPSLVELHLSFYTEITDPVAFTDLAYIPDNFAAHVLSLVQRSGCQGSLRKFRLNSANIPNLQLTTILVNLPSLTHLTLDNTFFDPTPFGDITYVYSKAPQFLPCLEVFELLRLSPDFPHDDIQFFAISRRESREPPRSLKRLTMTFRTHTPPDLFDLVHTFKDAFPMETTFFAFVE